MRKQLIVSILLLVGLANSYGFFQFSQPADVIEANGRIRGVRDRDDSDFVLGGLFPVHSDADGGASCGPIRQERGLERMEAMLYAIDLVNNDSTLLPGIKLGFDIRDTCNSENIGLDESIDLVITGSQLEIETCSNSDQVFSGNTTIPTSAIIGAAASAVSVPVATLLRLFQVPQVSYASSSARLNNRDRYSYFFRTISADNLQAEAMVDLCMKFNWTYVSTVYANDFYGEPGIDEFRSLALRRGMCIDVDRGIDTDFTSMDFENLASQLINSTANVTVLFASHHLAEKLFAQLKILNQANGTQRRFLWLASDAWARSISVVSQFNESLAGLLGVAPYTEFDVGFQEYFSQLTPITDKRNPWFSEFYEAYIGCKINSTCFLPFSKITDEPRYRQGNFIPLVIDSVYSIAHALQDFFNNNCEQPFEWYRSNRTCRGQINELNGSSLLSYIQNVSFVSPTGKKIQFDSNGNVEGFYEILNYQRINNKQYEFVSAGLWNGTVTAGSRLKLNESIVVQFGISENDEILYSRESQCQVCQPGEYRRLVIGSCCGTCGNCVGQYYSNSTQTMECSTCPSGSWGNDPLVGSTGCVDIAESFLEYSNPWAITLILLALIGILVIVFVSIVFGIFWNTPIVKSSGREQMILLLVGVTMCFVWTFFFVSKPSVAICFFQSVGLWLCFSLIFGALLTKLIRIARIFLRGHTSSRPRFTAPIFQVLFTFIVVAGQLLLVLISLVVVYPEASKLITDNNLEAPSVVVTCASSHIGPLVLLVIYDTILVIACNVLAILTIRFPDNFNEARYVSFTTFALGIIWLAFISTYIATSDELRAAVISFALNLSGFAVLACLFGPRIFIMLFLPNRNKKEFSSHRQKKNTTSIDMHLPNTSILDACGNATG